MIHEVRGTQWSAPPTRYQIDLSPVVVDYLEANEEGVYTHSHLYKWNQVLTNLIFMMNPLC